MSAIMLVVLILASVALIFAVLDRHVTAILLSIAVILVAVKLGGFINV